MCVLFFCVFLWEIERSHCMIQHTNNSLGSIFSHRAHRVHWAFWRTVRAHRRPPAYRGHRTLLPKMAVRFCEIGWLNVSVEYRVFCSSVFSVRKRTSLRLAGEYFLSQSAQSSRRFLAHISSPQKAFGIQRTQSVSAIVDTDKGQQAAYILFIGVSRWLLPFPSGEGPGEGPLSFWPLCVLFFCVLCEKKYVIHHLSLCHSV